jgi:hypothetical protein
LLSPNSRAMPSLSEVHRLCAQILRDFCLPPLASYLVSHQERCGARQCFWACIALGPPLLPHHPSTFLRRGRRQSIRRIWSVTFESNGSAGVPRPVFRLTPVRPDRRHDFPPAPYDRDAVVGRIFKAPTVQASLGALAGDGTNRVGQPSTLARKVATLFRSTRHNARSYRVTRTPPRRIKGGAPGTRHAVMGDERQRSPLHHISMR